MTTTADNVLLAIADLTARGVGRVQLGDVCAALDLTRSPVAAALASLVKAGRVAHHGVKGNGWYTVPESPELVRARAAKVAEDRATPAGAKAAIHALLQLATGGSLSVIVAVDGDGAPMGAPDVASRPFRGRRIVRARVLRVSVARAERVAQAEPPLFAWTGPQAVCNAVASGILERDARGPPGQRGSRLNDQPTGENQCRC